MQSKTLLRQTLLIVALAGFALSLALVFRFILKSLIESDSALLTANTTALYEQEKVNSDLPTGQAWLPIRLKIPRINVNAVVEHVGLASDGAMDVPKDPARVAWFNQGPSPGEKGSSVIAGHYGWKNNIPAVFDNLNKLQKGDKIYIEDERGVVITFVVRDIRSYDPKANSSEVFSSSDGVSHLNLVTCEGVWNKTEKSYSNRLVVFADKEVE